MPLPGGLSDKVGNRYEDRWTVRCVFDVLDNKAEAIRLEPPRPEDDGVEFWVRFADRVEYHQCKRQRTREGVWNLTALSSAGVLSAFLSKLSDPESRCLFVSTHATDALGELADRARAAMSLEEFTSVSLAATEWKSKFDKLRRAWGEVDTNAAFKALRRIHVSTIGEDELRAMNQVQAELVFAGDIDKSVPVLTDILRDSAGSYLTPADLWRALRTSGYEPNPWRSEQGLAVRVGAANRRFCASREHTLIAGRLIHRPEAHQLRELVASEPIVLVDGDAGAGKSDVLLQLIRGLEDDGIPHLALRLDHITPTLLPKEVGAELDLPASPVVTLAAHAQGELGVLVIDQLDIVSSASGRSPRFFDCVKEMIDAAAGMSNLRIVLSCRTFDVANDGRLRRLLLSGKASVLTIGPLAKQQVLATIATLGFDAPRLSEAQVEILAVPLHLALLAETASTLVQKSRVLSFVEASDLLRTLRDHNRPEVKHRLGRPPAWTEVLDALVDYMSKNQLLRAPIDVADQWQSDLTEMISSHVLTQDGEHVAFFHETFFDYVFARRFASRERTIAELLAADQDLFRRAQVRQILAYNRGRDSYLKDLQYVLTDESIRFHLRDVIAAWLAQVTPTPAEWTLLRPHLDNPQSPLHARAWRTVATPNWYPLLDQSGYAAACLDSADDARISRALSALVCGNGQFVDRALELLRPHVNESESWTRHLIWFLQHVDLVAHRPTFDLLLQLTDSGALAETGFAGRELWYLTDELPAANPRWANELLGHYLEERMTAAAAAGLRSPFERNANLIPRQLALHDYICKAAETDPESFFGEVWPRLLEIIEVSLLDERDYRLRPDHIWPIRHLHGRSRDFAEDLHTGAELAFAAFARQNPDQFSALVNDLSAARSETVVHLIFEGFAANPARFADDAISALAAHPGWLEVSWSNGHAWGTRKLLEAVTPHASGEALTQLESLLLAHYPPFERSAAGHDQFGWSQFTLLGGIIPERRSVPIVKRLAELRRKFERDDVPVPKGIRGGFVQSPISTDAVKMMSDSNWRGAIARYTSEGGLIFRDGDAPVGGAPQLANQLEEEARNSPERFASLAVNLPDSTDPRYFIAVLRGVADSDVPLPTEQIEALLLRCHRLPNRPCGMYITGPLLRCADDPISDAMVELITWYAGSEANPAHETSNPPQGDSIDEWLLYQGLNSVRGAVAEVIAQLTWHNADNVDQLKTAAMSLIGDRNAGVRAVAAQIVLALMHWDSGEALNAFERLTEDASDNLMATRYVYDFLHYRVGVDFPRLRPIVERMIRSQVGEVQEHGAALATLAALSDDAATELAQPCLEGTERQRLGAARVYAANLTTARFRQQCADALLRLFNDDSKLVRDAAAEVIGQFSGTDLGDFADVVEGLISSKAAEDNWDEVLQAQVEASSAATDLALSICERVLVSTSDDLGSTISYRSDLLSQVLVRVYTDAAGDARSRALDLIDLSLQQEIRAAERALAIHDRGWQ